MDKLLLDTLRINRLFDIYGNLLSSTQREFLYDYYEANLSLSEIAENKNISRTAVSDALKKGREKLEYYEEKIKICQVFDGYKEKNKEAISIIEELEEELKNGI